MIKLNDIVSPTNNSNLYRVVGFIDTDKVLVRSLRTGSESIRYLHHLSTKEKVHNSAFERFLIETPIFHFFKSE